MRKTWLTLLTMFSFYTAFSQNLISNCSFENYTTCPTAYSQVPYATGWFPLHGGTSDLMNTCNGGGSVGVPTNTFGVEDAAHGQGYAGGYSFTNILTSGPGNDYKEYVATTIPALTPGVPYELSMSIALGDASGWGTDDIGAMFFVNTPSFPSFFYGSPVTLNPGMQTVSYASYGAITDTANWTRVTTTFIPDSAYTIIAIGSLHETYAMTTISAAGGSSGYCYYYIDSVVLREANKISIGTVPADVCAGTGISIPYTLYPGASFNSGNTFTAQLSNATGSFASPTAIGSITSTAAGSISATIPAGTPAGTGYRIRIVSNSPVDSSQPNTVDIRITPPHTVSATTNAPICEGDTLFLNSSASVAGTSYTWTGPNSFSDANQNTMITPAVNSQSGKYAITTTRNACVATDTVDVLIKPMPVLTPTSNSPVCPGTTMQLNVTSTLPGTTFNWVGPNSFASTMQNPVRTPTTYADQGVYTVFGEKDGCHTQADIPVSVQITTATPVANNNGPLCMGAALNLTAYSITPGVTYIWTGPNNFNSTQQNPVINPSAVINDGKYIVRAVVNGCYSLPDTTDVTIYPDPYLGNYASPNDTVCEGTVVTFVTVPMNGVINPSFQWFKNGVAVPGETNLTFVSSYATGDTFYCRTYCQNSCGDNLTLYSNKVGMTVLPIVNDLSATISSVPAQAIPGQPVTFRATVVSGGYDPQYQWQKNGQDVWSATYAIWSTDKLAPYDKISCIVTTSDPCANVKTVSSDTVEVNFATGVDDVNNEGGFALYPNPNDGSFKVKIQKSKIKKIEVVNVAGQVVYSTQPETTQAEYSINLPQQLPAGTYMLRVYDGVQHYRKSFTLAR